MTATTVELRRYLQDQIASFKIPRRIVVQDQLPKGPTGKVLRRRLTESLTETTAAATVVGTPPSPKNTSLDSTLLTKLWERLLKIAPLSPDDNFFEKGGDSLLAVEMLTELEWLTGQTIPSSILFEAATARELALKLSEHGNIRVRSLIPMHSDGGQAPLFFFHGDYKGGYYAAELAVLLGSDQPLLIVAPHGIGDEPIPRSIEAMAADRLPLILGAQPKGPYRLCGNCLGGIVAFEVARMLVAAGNEVELVAMIDPPTINARRSVQLLFSIMGRALPAASPVVDRAKAWTWFKCATLQRVLNLPMTQRWAWVKEKAQNVFARRKDQTRTTPNVAGQSDTDQPEMGRVDVSLFRLFADERVSKYALAMSNYFPRPLDVRVIYFSTEYGVGTWRRLSPNIEVIKLPGNHYDYDLASLADRLSARLRAHA
jgi:thioesterase domain-containing protein/acyl carrier protein